jgi:hypothetical protein
VPLKARRARRARRVRRVLMLVGAGLVCACAAPFAEMQSARLAGPGRFELTPVYSFMDLVDDGETLKLQDTYGLHAATGISSRFDLRIRVDHIRLREIAGENLSATAVGIGPKVALITDRLALYAPVGAAIGTAVDMSETWQFHPSLIGTLPLLRAVEVNAGLKALIPITTDEGDPDDDTNELLVALTLGLGIAPEQSRWAIRPEVGFMKNPGESGTVRHFSLGMTFFVGRARPNR